jgi:hypothetical protein
VETVPAILVSSIDATEALEPGVFTPVLTGVFITPLLSSRDCDVGEDSCVIRAHPSFIAPENSPGEGRRREPGGGRE